MQGTAVSHSGTTLRGRTLFITGATRGIGLAIAKRAARDGARIVVLGKTLHPHPKLPGTIDTACEEITRAGGEALGVVCDIRDEEQVTQAVDRTVERFGGIDILINNASAIFLATTEDTPLKRFDLMHQVNARGTFLCAQKCLPHLKQSSHARILTLSPPLDLRAEYFGPHVSYSLSKFGMSLCTLGWAEELAPHGIGVNSLWPKTVIDTAAVRNLLGGDQVAQRARSPSIVADAAYEILIQPSSFTGHFLLDEEVLLRAGQRDLSGYAVTPGASLLPDFFVPATGDET